MTTEEVYSWIVLIVCIGLCQSSLADIIASGRHKTIMNFPIAYEKLVSRYMKAFRFVYDGAGAWISKALLLLCALACMAITLAGLNPVIVLVAIFVLHLLSYPRWRHFVGSDSPLFRAIFTALILHYFLPDNRVIAEAGLFFLAVYLVLIYSLTAIQKIKAKLWRNGQAMANFMNRYPFWRMISPAPNKPKWLVKLGSWSVMLFEFFFFTGLLWPEAAPVFLTAGLVFHGVLSLTVGINHFFWTFIAVYPAYFYISARAPEVISLFRGVLAGL